LGPNHPEFKSLAAMLHAAEQGAGLTRQLLVFCRREPVQSAILDLNEVLEKMDGILRQLINEGIELTVTRGRQVSRIKADPSHVKQVLMNLVANARDAMPSGGQLSITTSDVTLDESYTVDHPGVVSGDYVMLSITDTGFGFSNETKARVFEPFFTTKPKGQGTGLGLATCHTIVRQSGGHIDLASEVGKGTTFKIYFPRVTQFSYSTTPPFQGGPLPRGTEKLLVVEDNPEVRFLVSTVLRRQGYEVLAAANGKDGLRTVLENKGQAIGLVITDVVMPQMGGKEMSGRLRTTAPGLKVLFTSGYTDDTIAHYGVLDPDIAFLSKPYSVAILSRKVRELLDARVAAEEPSISNVSS
jgi:two-component system, cell cycle sensor histidine kinase and response regulator CckA